MGLLDGLKKKKDATTEEDKQEIYQLPADYKLLEETVQDFLPFDDIENSMICLKDSKYRMVVEVSSINYYLKTSEEQEVIEAQFRAAISSFDFPFAFYVQTRTIDGEMIVQNIRNDVSTYTSQYVFLRKYGEDYIKEMEKMHSHDNSALIKKNYIIVSCDDEAASFGNPKTEAEKRRTAYDKLSLSVQKVYEGLRPMGLRCHCLTNEELAELLFAALNKQAEFKAEDIAGSMSDFVDSDSGYAKFNDKITLLVSGFENQMKLLIEGNNELTREEIGEAYAVLDKLHKLREQSTETVTSGDLFQL